MMGVVQAAVGANTWNVLHLMRCAEHYTTAA